MQKIISQKELADIVDNPITYDTKTKKIIPLVNGIGDSIIFRKVLTELKSMYGNRKIVLGTLCPELFEDIDGVETIELVESMRYEHYNRFNIYWFMYVNKWNGTLENAYRALLLSDAKEDSN